MPTWRTLDDAAKQLKISRRTLSRWIKRGEINTYTIAFDRHVYVDMDQIARLRKPKLREPHEKSPREQT